jgi:hypothetical protein
MVLGEANLANGGKKVATEQLSPIWHHFAGLCKYFRPPMKQAMFAYGEGSAVLQWLFHAFSLSPGSGFLF